MFGMAKTEMDCVLERWERRAADLSVHERPHSQEAAQRAQGQILKECLEEIRAARALDKQALDQVLEQA